MSIAGDLLSNNSRIRIMLFMGMILIFAHCKSTKDNQPTMEEIKSTLKTSDNEDVECIDNEMGTLTLCHTQVKQDPLKPDYLLKFVVLEKNTNKVVYQESVTGGYVKWIDNDKLEYYSAPGIIPEGKTRDNYVKVYDVNTKDVITKEAFLLKKDQ